MILHLDPTYIFVSTEIHLDSDVSNSVFGFYKILPTQVNNHSAWKKLYTSHEVQLSRSANGQWSCSVLTEKEGYAEYLLSKGSHHLSPLTVKQWLQRGEYRYNDVKVLVAARGK